jgi:hypothetical protein
MSNVKVKNAKKVDIHGNVIYDITEWKQLNPGSTYFDSRLELFCFNTFSEMVLDFIVKPNKITIVPKLEALDWEYSSEDTKKLRDLQKGVKIASERSANTRMFNKHHSKGLFASNTPAWTWSPDFLLLDFKYYVDTKGNKKDPHWRNKLKAARQLLLPDGYQIIQLQTKKEVIKNK